MYIPTAATAFSFYPESFGSLLEDEKEEKSFSEFCCAAIGEHRRAGENFRCDRLNDDE